MNAFATALITASTYHWSWSSGKNWSWQAESHWRKSSPGCSNGCPTTIANQVLASIQASSGERLLYLGVGPGASHRVGFPAAVVLTHGRSRKLLIVWSSVEVMVVASKCSVQW